MYTDLLKLIIQHAKNNQHSTGSGVSQVDT